MVLVLEKFKHFKLFREITLSITIAIIITVELNEPIQNYFKKIPMNYKHLQHCSGKVNSEFKAKLDLLTLEFIPVKKTNILLSYI